MTREGVLGESPIAAQRPALSFGDYATRKQELEIRDLAKVADLLRLPLRMSDKLPPFGWAVRWPRQQVLVPLGLEYNVSSGVIHENISRKSGLAAQHKRF